MLAFDPPVMNIDHGAIHRALDNPKTDAVLYAKFLKMKGIAIAIMTSEERHTHLPTLPLYLASFRIDKVRGRMRLTNDDPAAFWVELGAYIHHPTHPRILAYHPLGKAQDAVAASKNEE